MRAHAEKRDRSVVWSCVLRKVADKFGVVTYTIRCVVKRLIEL